MRVEQKEAMQPSFSDMEYVRSGKCKPIPVPLSGRVQEHIVIGKVGLRAKVGHAFRIAKNTIQLKKVSYRSLSKNSVQPFLGMI